MHVIYVLGDDWEGIYTNGKLVMEGHSLGVSQLLNWVRDTGRKIAKVETVEADLGWLHDRGSLPDSYADVVKVGEYFPVEAPLYDSFDDA